MNLPNLAELALELRLAELDATFAEMSYACELEAMCAGKRRSKLEHIAAAIDLSPASTRDVLDQCERRAKLLNETHRLLRALIEVEQDADLAA